MLTAIALALLGTASTASGETISLCDVVARPGRFAGEKVSIEASLMPEDLLLFDGDCNNFDNWVQADMSQVRDQWERLWASGEMSTGQPVGVRVAGVFDGPDGVGYGHLATFRTRLRIGALEILPRSRWRNSLPARAMTGVLSEASTRSSALEERLFEALFSADFAGLDDLLDENFMLSTPTGAVLYRSQLALRRQELIESLRPIMAGNGTQSSTVASYAFDARTVLVRRTAWFANPDGSAGAVRKSPLLETECFVTRVGDGWKARFFSVRLEQP